MFVPTDLLSIFHQKMIIFVKIGNQESKEERQ